MSGDSDFRSHRSPFCPLFTKSAETRRSLFMKSRIFVCPNNHSPVSMMESKRHTYTEDEAYEKLSALCAMSELCCHDAERKMRRWELSSEVIERVTRRLVKERFIDEERFAHAFVRDKFRYNHWGSVRIEQELRLRKRARQHIDKALCEISTEDNQAALQEMIAKKRPSVKGKSDYEIRAKLIRFALGRGFAMDDIMKVVGSMEA